MASSLGLTVQICSVFNHHLFLVCSEPHHGIGWSAVLGTSGSCRLGNGFLLWLQRQLFPGLVHIPVGGAASPLELPRLNPESTGTCTYRMYVPR